MSQARIKAPVRRTSSVSPTLLVFGVMLVMTLTLLGWGALVYSDPAALPIRKVLVDGEFTHLDPEHLKAAVVESVDAGFFGLDVGRIQRRLLDEPWIRAASIRRVWPDALQVSIVEQTPAARWGDAMAMNEVGDLFAPDAEQLPADLVRLDGPLGSELAVLTEYRRIRHRLADVGLEVTALSLSERHAWTIHTADNKELVVGRQSLYPRLARFVVGYRRSLQEVWAQIRRVDLRYTNGFAVLGQPLVTDGTQNNQQTSGVTRPGEGNNNG